MSESILDPAARALLDAAARGGLPPVYRLPVEDARARMRAAFIRPGDEAVTHRDHHLARPGGSALVVREFFGAAGAKGGVLFVHGGGWTVNDLDTHARLCALLAKELGDVVFSVGVSCAPEAKYPTALDECYVAWRWLLDNAQRLGLGTGIPAVAGDSSGATLALGLSMLSRDRGAPLPSGQLLFYPVADHYAAGSNAYIERGTGYSLDAQFMAWAWENYLPGRYDPADPYLFPLRAESLAGLPRTVLVTAEFDPLRDEGVALARALEVADVPSVHLHADDQMHGFAMQTGTIPRALKLVQEACAVFRTHTGDAQ